MTDPTTQRRTVTPFVRDVMASAWSGEWPACADCASAVWLVDQDQAKAYCNRFGGLMSGEGDCVITKCGGHAPIAS